MIAFGNRDIQFMLESRPAETRIPNSNNDNNDIVAEIGAGKITKIYVFSPAERKYQQKNNPTKGMEKSSSYPKYPHMLMERYSSGMLFS